MFGNGAVFGMTFPCLALDSLTSTSYHNWDLRSILLNDGLTGWHVVDMFFFNVKILGVITPCPELPQACQVLDNDLMVQSSTPIWLPPPRPSGFNFDLRLVNDSTMHGHDYWPETTYRVPGSEGTVSRKGKIELIGGGSRLIAIECGRVPNEGCSRLALELAPRQVQCLPPSSPIHLPSSGNGSSFSQTSVMVFPRTYAPAMGFDSAPRRRIAFRGAGTGEDIENGGDGHTRVDRGTNAIGLRRMRCGPLSHHLRVEAMIPSVPLAHTCADALVLCRGHGSSSGEHGPTWIPRAFIRGMTLREEWMGELRRHFL
ncbi:hypothetical protein ARMGADRAFT_1167420 [Armillaria gallica]|uniref:Uncharacterized protein n=1 Tax=Armillaria gallica TaxID=47427 RepID=A0A2H3D314_ARMGA|nr:hypothetical protein ARMGADRAFT_1167420 [Armillaria gallica]